MDNYDISYALLETSLGNSIDDFIDRILIDLRIDYSNQSHEKDMPTEEMNILKSRISSIIDVEIESVMETLKEERENAFESLKVIENIPISKKEESLPLKASDSDETSELELALIISEADSSEKFINRQDLNKKKDQLKDSMSKSTVNLRSQFIQAIKKVLNSPEMMKNPIKTNNNGHLKNESTKVNKSGENLQNLVDQTQDKHMEIALALSAADEKEKNIRKEIQESNFNRTDKIFHNHLSLENESLRLMNKKYENQLLMKTKENENMRRETEFENLLIQNRICERIKDCINDIDLKPYTKQSILNMKLWIDCYSALSVPRKKLNNILENENNLSVNDISLIILELFSILKKFDKEFISKLFSYIRPHIEEISKICSEFATMYLFDSEKHVIDRTVDSLHPIFLTEFERVQVRGDGNCLWNSISVSMFGDYSFMESLRLLTATTLNKHQLYFQNYLNEQRVKFGYRHDLTFKQLIDASTELTVWGDEYHLLALSLALHRPIISYGSFAQISNLREDMTYEDLKTEYEREDQINHMLYVGDSNDKHNIPICIYYNGVNHYCAILPKRENVKPLMPKTQLFDYVIDKGKQELSRSDTTSILCSKEYRNSHNSAHWYMRSSNSGLTTNGINQIRPEVSDNKFHAFPSINHKIHTKIDPTVKKSVSKNEIQESRFNRGKGYGINDYLKQNNSSINKINF